MEYMIPLLRPQMPSPSDFWPLLQEGERAGIWSNFGPCHESAVAALRQMTARHPVLTNSGTAAIRVAVHTMFGGPHKNRVVAVPEFTCVATLMAVVEAGYTPLIAPCDPQTWCIDAEWLFSERDNYDGFVVVSPFGYRVNFELYDRMAEEIGRPVVYDLAGAWGLPFEKTKNPVCFSLHATKNMAVGEGGMVLFYCEEAKRAERAKALTCFDYDKRRASQSYWGTNAKMDEVHAAMLICHLRSMHEVSKRITRKKELLAFYQAHLYESIVEQTSYVGAAPSLCAICTPLADRLEKAGQSAGIQFRRYYHPTLSDMPMLNGLRSDRPTDPIFRKIVAFPSDATEAEAQQVVEFVRRMK